MAEKGDRVSEYVLDERVGAGAFGEVWRAYHHVWRDQVVAVKLPTDGSRLRSLQREGRLLHGLAHPSIVRAIGFDPEANPPYLVMEYVPGTNLRARIRPGGMPYEEARAILAQVLDALDAAHARGIVHGDLKPENILIHERAAREGLGAPGVVKVTDFGLGRPLQGMAQSIQFSASLDRDQARIAGTLAYMSPEQRDGGALDQRCDLYACGILLYEMLTGERPAGAERPSDLRRDLPEHVDEVFARAYARLESRFETARQFMEALGAEPARRAPHATAASPCPRCRGLVFAADQFCIHCGTQLAADVRRCPHCQAFPGPDDRYCIFCGKPLSFARAARVEATWKPS